MKVPVLIIGGPTASGKSSLALDLAQELDGIIINGDSLQIYKGLEILTASPSHQDRQEVPHRLYGLLDKDHVCTVGMWQDLALREITSAKGKFPIIVGGTGLYLDSLIKGLSTIPPISKATRDQARQEYETLGANAFHHRLQEIDPQAASRIAPGDTQRMTRAWEVYLETQVPLSQWQQKKKKKKIKDLNPFSILVLPDRETLYAHAEERFAHMIDLGVLEEVKATMTIISPSHPLTKAIGFLPLAEYLKNHLTLEEAIDQSKTMTRQYIKRQYTWFRNQVQNAFMVDHIYARREKTNILSDLLETLRQKNLW